MNTTRTRMVLTCAVLVAGVMIGQAETIKDQCVDLLDAYNVAWDSPSKDAHGSMPLGNGDVGVNAWVEESGDLVFYVSKTDAWDENARLCKIGRVRVKFDPPLAAKDKFRQELKLRDGVIEIESKIQNQPSTIRLWVDAGQPVVRVEAESAVPVSCRAEVELWRLRERPLVPQEDYGYGDGKSPQAQAYKLTVLPDAVVFDQARQTTATWWQAFWNRSRVFVEEDGSAKDNAVAKSGATTTAPSVVTQGYVLQRFMNACSGRGGSPIKFNGSIFTVEKNPGASPKTEDGDPDWRNWGGSYWFQNTRLSYWPMLAGSISR